MGTGLGLAVVHGIVKNHQGGIRVVSTPGVGSTFQIFFPVAGEVAELPVEEQEAPSGSGERLLFVDDEAQVVEVGCEQLELLGYSVTAVNDSREAWDLFKAHPETYDVIVTDQTMPHITGLELAEKIKHLRPGIPILLTTGHSELVNAASLARAGIQVVLKKPYRRAVLARAVKRAMSDGGKADVIRS